MDNKLLEYLNHRVEEQNKIYGGIVELQMMMGGANRKKFNFKKNDKIGYTNTKVMKINCSKNELKIAQIIMDNPHKNLIKIYEVNKKKKEIVLERLKTSIKTKNYKNYVKDLSTNLKQLNKLGIAYVDLKTANTGYSKIDKKWKIFDFDYSGVYNKSRWVLKPPNSYVYRTIKNLDLKPSEIDKYIFKYFKKHIKSKSKYNNGPLAILFNSYGYLDLIKPGILKKFHPDVYKMQENFEKLSKKKSRKKSSKKKSRKKSSRRKSRRKSSKKKSRRKSSRRKSRRKSSKKKSRRKSSKKKSRRKSSRRKSRKSRKSKRKSRKSKRKSR